MLTGIAAGEIAEFTVYVFKFQLISLGAFHDCTAFGAIEADVTHAAFHVIVMTELGDFMADFHGREVIQLEAGVIIAGSIDVIFLVRHLKPGNDLGIRQGCGIEGNEMRPGKEKLAFDLCICNADHALVIGQLDFEVISNIHHAAAQPFELSVHIHDVSDLEIECIVVVGQSHIPGRKMDADNRLPCRLFGGGKQRKEWSETQTAPNMRQLQYDGTSRTLFPSGSAILLGESENNAEGQIKNGKNNSTKHSEYLLIL